MTVQMLHSTERRAEFPPDQFVSFEALKKFVCHFHAFADSDERAARLFEPLTSVDRGEIGVSLTVWCAECRRHREHCKCTPEALDQWRIPKEDFIEMREALEQEKIWFREQTVRTRTLALEFIEHLR